MCYRPEDTWYLCCRIWPDRGLLIREAKRGCPQIQVSSVDGRYHIPICTTTIPNILPLRHRKRLTWQNVQKKTFYCINRKITDWPWNDWHKKLFYSIFSNISFDYIMVSGVEQEFGSLNTPMALAHPIHPFRKRSGNKSSITWVGLFVSSWVSRWASCVPFTNFLIEVYFFHDSCHSWDFNGHPILWNYMFKLLSISGIANAHLFKWFRPWIFL